MMEEAVIDFTYAGLPWTIELRLRRIDITG